MACARRKDRNIPSSDFDFTTSGSAQHQPRRTGRKPEYLVCSGMIVMEGINAISPLRRPASALEERLEGRSCYSAASGRNHPPIQEDGKNWIVWHPVVRVKEKGFRLHGRFSILTERCYARERTHCASGYDFYKSATFCIRHIFQLLWAYRLSSILSRSRPATTSQ
jgi:hypothetical protein